MLHLIFVILLDVNALLVNILVEEYNHVEGWSSATLLVGSRQMLGFCGVLRLCNAYCSPGERRLALRLAI